MSSLALRRSLSVMALFVRGLRSQPVCDNYGPQQFILRAKRRVSPDSHVLTFALPAGERLTSDTHAPTGVKCLFHSVDEAGESLLLDKSYSPVSLPQARWSSAPPGPTAAAQQPGRTPQPQHPNESALQPQRITQHSSHTARRCERAGIQHWNQTRDGSNTRRTTPQVEGYFELLVKAYPPQPGGGLGAHLCGLEVGQSATMKIKPPRPIHGRAGVGPNRWGALLYCTTVLLYYCTIALLRYCTIAADDLRLGWRRAQQMGCAGPKKILQKHRRRGGRHTSAPSRPNAANDSNHKARTKTRTVRGSDTHPQRDQTNGTQVRWVSLAVEQAWRR